MPFHVATQVSLPLLGALLGQGSLGRNILHEERLYVVGTSWDQGRCPSRMGRETPQILATREPGATGALEVALSFSFKG